jgi:hypothetical protein
MGKKKLVIESDEEDYSALKNWASTWVGLFKPYYEYYLQFSNFIREEWKAGVFGDYITEALLGSDLGCELIASANKRNYIRCGDDYIMTPSTAELVSVKDFEKLKEFFKKTDEKVEVEYWSLMEVKVYSTGLIKADRLKNALSLSDDTYIAIVQVWFPWFDIMFIRRVGWEHLVTFLYSQTTGKVEWIGERVDDKGVRNSAMQDILEHIHELDTALSKLLRVMEIGFSNVARKFGGSEQ